MLYSCLVVSNSFSDPMDCSLPDSFVHGISQARILAWIAISFSRACSQPRDQTCVPCIGRLILYHCLFGICIRNTFCLSVACFFSTPLIMSYDEDVHNFDVIQFIRDFPLWSIYFVSIRFKTADSKVINVFSYVFL